MKTKLCTSIIVVLVIIGVALAIPVPSAQAWGCKTHFTGWARPKIVGPGEPGIPGTPILNPGTLVKEWGDYQLWDGVQIQYYHTWDSPSWVDETFGEGVIVNTVKSLNNLQDGSSTMWGTHVLTFDDITLTGWVYGKRYTDAEGNSVTRSWWVSRGDGYRVIWQFDSRKDRQDSGIIIEV
jgi:hypothetical protein